MAENIVSTRVIASVRVDFKPPVRTRCTYAQGEAAVHSVTLDVDVENGKARLSMRGHSAVKVKKDGTLGGQAVTLAYDWAEKELSAEIRERIIKSASTAMFLDAAQLGDRPPTS